jgi:DNA-binding transcriptional ArsR family regulator
MKAKTAVDQLSALAQGTRLEIFRLLVKTGPEGMPAGDIAKRLKVLPATLSFHLTHLARSGLVRSCQQGRFVIYSADFPEMEALLAFLTEDCCGGAVACAIPACQTVRLMPRRTAKARGG